MAFWNRSVKEPKPADPLADPFQGTRTTTGPQVREEVFTEKELPKPRAQEPASKPSNNIELLYAFMDRNHEENGYNDALRNPDSKHLEQNIDELRNELGRTIKKVRTFYDDFIKEINFHIESRGKSGMVDTVAELEMKKAIANSHIEKVQEIETDAQNDRGDSQGIIISYTRGFKNGLAAISHFDILNRKF